MDLKNITFAEFIRYGLTGLNTIIILFIVPIAVLRPDIIKEIIKVTGMFGIALLSFGIGFLLDTLKLYQFSPGYKKRKGQFLSEFASTLEIESKDASSFFSMTTKISRDHHNHEIENRQSRWIMADHTSKVILASIIAWVILLLIVKTSTIRIIVSVGIIVFYVFLFFRLHTVASQERAKSNQNYINFAKHNTKMITEIWKIDQKQSDNKSEDKSSSS
ncbi:hypothetical protein QUF90_20355 [Desulfococcaceae bacterium HSG9]|nr:hypothetical protein [Desulfococcaceae bacterium HSG9]